MTTDLPLLNAKFLFAVSFGEKRKCAVDLRRIEKVKPLDLSGFLVVVNVGRYSMTAIPLLH